MSKKFFVFIAIAVTATLFAENETVSCESDYGKCSFELSDETLSQKCVCSNGREFSGSDPIFEGYTLPTEEGCEFEIDRWCKNIAADCSNDAGACKVNENGKYECYCHYVDGQKTGSGYFGEEGCNEILVETCGCETPTPRKICPEGILDECVSYFERIKNTCSKEPINDINEILDAPIDYAYSNITVHEFADCCRSEYWRNEYKRESDCIETFDSCENKECCECTIQVGGEDSAENAGSNDSTDTEAPTTGATPEDSADGVKKEESKSDGCSILFI